ncbi:putative mitochondrial transporter UCP3 isoform X1 [Bos javanicus]|uniref:putative mitochondrial transporter UCP3 isoform X1 n=1 Tax=Bos javanicus TaxID=9906 RepID=UPI002AA5FD94|nr:putative mitochondrial transporter UCP3 isoform X1 [Bos javanicus]
MVGLQPSERPPTTAVKFLAAGTAACFADLLTFPLDTAKVRLQIQGENQVALAARSAQYRGVLGTILTMVRTEGPRSLYSGLVAGLQRQMSFASIRIGLYDSVKQFYTPKGSDHSSIITRILAGCTTGAMAVTCAQPTDVVKIRFQASMHTGPGGNRKYSGTMDAYRTIAREEGVRGLWKGILPNITRNAIVNCGEMVTYDIIKEKLLDYHLLTAQYLLFPPCDRQLPLPLCLCLWSWLLCHPGGLPGGRGEDAVYELAPRPVPQPLRLHAEDGDPGGPHSLLQGIYTLLFAFGILECGDVRHLRADETGLDESPDATRLSILTKTRLLSI